MTLESLAGFGWERPYHGVALWTFMLGMAGFPLTGGMFGKLFVFSAAYDAGEWWLVLIGVAATAVSLGYYLNVVRWMYMRPGAELRLAVGRRLAASRLGARHRDRGLRRRHGRLLLRRAADPRRGLRRGFVASVLESLPWRPNSPGSGTRRSASTRRAGKRIYVDPFLNGNPKCPECELEPERCDLILVTHGHGDHVGDTVAIHQRFGCPVVAQVELRGWLTAPGRRRRRQGATRRTRAAPSRSRA